MGEVEHHHIGIAILSYEVETLLIRHRQQTVVTIDNLDKLSLGHIHRRVSCHTDTAIFLTHVDDVIAVFQQIIHRTLIRTVVYDNNLPLSTLEVQFQDAVDTLAEHVCGQVVAGHDETDQRLSSIVACCHTVV